MTLVNSALKKAFAALAAVLERKTTGEKELSQEELALLLQHELRDRWGQMYEEELSSYGDDLKQLLERCKIVRMNTHAPGYQESLTSGEVSAIATPATKTPSLHPG